MLLYLTSSGKSSLVDAAANQMELNAKKLIGKFNLKSIVAKDMRNYTAAKFFVVDASCCEETPEEFCVALQSFQMMFSTRIIVILSGCEEEESYLSCLLTCGITNIIIADTPDAVTDELVECLSEQGMQRYIRPYGFVEEEITVLSSPEKVFEEEIHIYEWNAKNVKIAVAGAQHRCGTTMTAFNMAYWLSARGADVALIEMNTNRHLHFILNVYEAVKEKEHYTIDGVDFYLTDELDRNYNFIIYDCGVLNALPVAFRDADQRLLCGSALPYELSTFSKAVSLCGNLPVEKIGIYIPDEMRDYCVSVFGTDLQLAESSHSLFSAHTNGEIYMGIVKGYIES